MSVTWNVTGDGNIMSSRDVDLSIPVLPEMELTAMKTAEAVGEFMNLDHTKIEEVKVALIEACINAFEHSQSQAGRVDISFAIGDTALTVTISDDGQGFDPADAQTRVEKRRSDGERKRGWGLMIMKELMDEVTIKSGESGTTLTMVKHR